MEEKKGAEDLQIKQRVGSVSVLPSCYPPIVDRNFCLRVCEASTPSPLFAEGEASWQQQRNLNLQLKQIMNQYVNLINLLFCLTCNLKISTLKYLTHLNEVQRQCEQLYEIYLSLSIVMRRIILAIKRIEILMPQPTSEARKRRVNVYLYRGESARYMQNR